MTVSKNVNFKKSFAQQLVENIFFTIVGLFALLSLVLGSILVILPTLLYCWIITKFVVPKYHPDIREIITGGSHAMATEFLSERIASSAADKSILEPKKYTVVSNIITTGTITFDQVESLITKGWLTVKEGESKLKYPEFQQYIEPCMGFMFWKQDLNFSLKNHLFVHEIPTHSSSAECEEKFNDLVETLMNRTYAPNRSPWEVHVLQNYRNPKISNGKETSEKDDDDVSTIVVIGFHHALMDGYSTLYAISEGLLGHKLPSIGMALPKSDPDDNENLNAVLRFSKRWIYNLWRIVYDLGYLAILRWRNTRPSSKTPWHVSRGKESALKQIIGRSEIIPVEKIKFIKNQLGVRFTSVLLSCLGAGAAHSFESKGFTGEYSFPLLTIVPVPVHPNKLENNLTGTYLDLVAYPNLDPVTRLKITHEKFLDARYFSKFPIILLWFAKLLSSLPASMVKRLAINKVTPSIMSNVSGPGIKMVSLGREWLAGDFCVAGMPGVSGVTFGIGSYNGNFKFGVTAETAVMDRKELADLIRAIEREVDLLYDCATKVTLETSEKILGKED